MSDLAARRDFRATISAVLLIAAGISRGAFAGERHILAEAIAPETITISGTELYLVDKSRILVFSLKDHRLLRIIGGPGDGPGELKPAGFWYHTATVLRDDVFVDGFDKIIRFSKDGRFLDERKKPLGLGRTIPVGGNFAGVDMDFREQDVQYQRLLLLDANGKILRELARQRSPVQSVSRETDMIPDVLTFATWQGRIYVERSPQGFLFDVFDSGGAFLYRIEKNIERIALTKDLEKAAVDALEADPFVRRIGFEEFQRLSRLIRPKTLPAIRDFAVADGKIYARTFRTRDGREEWRVLGLDGRMLFTTRLPRMRGTPFMASLYGHAYFAVDEGKLYCLEYDESSEGWALVIEEIRP